MKFRCERDTLAEAVATAQRTVASRSWRAAGAPGSAHHRDRATASSSSAPTSRSPTACRCRPRSRRRASRSCRSCWATSCASSSPGPVTVAVTGDEAVITAGRFTTSLRLKPAEDYPRLASDRRRRRHASTLPAFAPALRQVVRAASKDDLRPILTGVLLTTHGGGLRLVATDSYRLAVRDLKGVSMLERGPAGPRRGQGPGRGAAAGRRRRDRSRAARTRRRVPHVPRRGHRPADRG